LPPSPVGLNKQVKTPEPDCNLARNVGETLLIGNAPCLRRMNLQIRLLFGVLRQPDLEPTAGRLITRKEYRILEYELVSMTGRKRERDILCVCTYMRTCAHPALYVRELARAQMRTQLFDL